jgi:molecular chaperone GrpE (heat shock protein)
MVKKQLGDVFAAQKCDPISSEKGSAFDPAVHNAIKTAPKKRALNRAPLPRHSKRDTVSAKK